MLNIQKVVARDLPDLWFQAIYGILQEGREFKIDKGSYEGQTRFEYDYFIGHVTFPGNRPLLPDIPSQYGIPNPVEEAYLYGGEGYSRSYIEYLMTPIKEPGESYCYSEDTEILTNEGWKFFKDLNKTESVATLNPDTGEIIYQYPDDYVAFNFSGEVFELNNKCINFCVNAGHSLYVAQKNIQRKSERDNFGLININEINSKFLRFKKDGIWNGKEVKTFSIPGVYYDNSRYSNVNNIDLKIPMNKWLLFLGLWLAEGSLRKGKDFSYTTVITMCNIKNRVKAKSICENAGFTVSEYKKDLFINDKRLFKYLEKFGHAHDKFIPREILELSKGHLNFLFDGMMFGDGDNSGYRYTTVSERLANDFTELCFKLGLVAQKVYDNHSYINSFKSTSGVYRVYISRNYNMPTVPSTIVTKKYSGKLYCVRVAQYHILFIRRKGIAHWSGNTYGERLTHHHRLNQIEHIINTYKTYGYRNNQMVLQVAQPSDLLLSDPPCLRSIDTRIQDGKLHFFVYFRSWDLWGGFPANLAAIQHLKEYMAGEIGVEDGEMVVESKGLHLYDYAVPLAKIRCMQTEENR